jgi:hypothetical protein
MSCFDLLGRSLDCADRQWQEAILDHSDSRGSDLAAKGSRGDAEAQRKITYHEEHQGTDGAPFGAQ